MTSISVKNNYKFNNQNNNYDKKEKSKKKNEILINNILDLCKRENIPVEQQVQLVFGIGTLSKQGNSFATELLTLWNNKFKLDSNIRLGLKFNLEDKIQIHEEIKNLNNREDEIKELVHLALNIEINENLLFKEIIENKKIEKLQNINSNDENNEDIVKNNKIEENNIFEMEELPDQRTNIESNDNIINDNKLEENNFTEVEELQDLRSNIEVTEDMINNKIEEINITEKFEINQEINIIKNYEVDQEINSNINKKNHEEIKDITEDMSYKNIKTYQINNLTANKINNNNNDGRIDKLIINYYYNINYFNYLNNRYVEIISNYKIPINFIIKNIFNDYNNNRFDTTTVERNFKYRRKKEIISN
eukprot:jgi/Orpsp1_1/1188546/evm.model.d7180000065650.1